MLEIAGGVILGGVVLWTLHHLVLWVERQGL